MDSSGSNADRHAARAQAERWVVRRDRGLSATEAVEFELWLAADERHAVLLRESMQTWSRLDGLPEHLAQRSLRQATRRRSFWRRTIVAVSAAAAALAIGVMAWKIQHRPPVGSPSIVSTLEPRLLALSDGTVVHLNIDSEIVEEYSRAERRVRLTRGEAHFSVVSNPARPFIVQAGALAVRAVGTAFNVNWRSSGIDVLVTEGQVTLAASSPAPGTTHDAVPPTISSPRPLLHAGQRAVLPHAAVPASDPAHAVIISDVDPAEVARVLAWQNPLLRLGGATLAQVIREFERQTGRRVILADPELGSLRLGGRIRVDDADAFTELLASALSLTVEHGADGTLYLRKKGMD